MKTSKATNKVKLTDAERMHEFYLTQGVDAAYRQMEEYVYTHVNTPAWNKEDYNKIKQEYLGLLDELNIHLQKHYSHN